MAILVGRGKTIRTPGTTQPSRTTSFRNRRSARLRAICWPPIPLPPSQRPLDKCRTAITRLAEAGRSSTTTQSEDRSHVQHEGFRVRDSELVSRCGARARLGHLMHECRAAAVCMPQRITVGDLRNFRTHIFSPSLINEARVGVNLIWLPEYTTTTGPRFWGKYGIHPLISNVTVLPNKDIRP